MFDLVSEILQTLRHNKLRTALTGFSVAWGVFMLIVLLSMARGLTNAFHDDFMGSGAKQISVWGGRTSKAYHGYKEGRRIKLRDDDMGAIEDAHPSDIVEVTSEVYGKSPAISTATRHIDGGYTGVYPSYLEREGHKLLEGRSISDRDIERLAKVMVLPTEYATQLFPPDGKGAVGSRVRCNGLSFLVIGVYKGHWGRNNLIPYTTAKMMQEKKDETGGLSVLLSDNVREEGQGRDVEKGVRQTLAATHEFDPDDDSSLWVFNKFVNSLQMENGMNILNVGVWVLGLMTLLSGVVGISNIMFVSVKERTHEIGIRRAIGARPARIVTQVIAEGVAITTLFGYIGIVLGTVVAQLIAMALGDQPFMKNPTVSLAIAFEVTAVLIVAGALAGFFPALKALKVKPVEALRDE
ncbi:MAG: ABC transporter permease [[Clostridium] fimetarium]|nr:ABC transporter permease [Alistipes timonensis]MCM1405505.1 ABC transporter permease [[Clostridium] fimetarium]